MGAILESYGEDAYEHEGYVAQVLDDGTLAATDGEETTPRMIGQVVAACACGWAGVTRYPTAGLVDKAAEELALAEWEHDHARPTLESVRAERWEQLRTLVRELAESHATTTRARFSALAPAAQRELLDRTLACLERATRLAVQFRGPLGERPAGGAQ